VATEMAIASMRRSLRLALIAAVLMTAVPILELFRARRPQVLLVATASALILWATFLVRRRAFRAAVADPESDVRSI
jgi:hypothetical protein